MGVPKRLHFIWVGFKSLPDQNGERIKKWMDQNPDFSFTLWVDKVGTSDDIIKEYQSTFHVYLNKNQLQIRDITEAGVSTPQVRYEIDRLRPNYGSASDLLRLNILSLP